MKQDHSQFDNLDGTESSVDDPKNFFERMTSRLSKQTDEAIPAPPSIKTKEALLLLQNYEETRQGWFWSTDPDGNLTYLTESVAQVLGKTAKELIGTSFTQLFVSVEQNADNQRTLPFLLTKQTKFVELQLQAATEND